MSSNTPLPRERKPLRLGSKEEKVILSVEENWYAHLFLSLSHRPPWDSDWRTTES
jgi:hypothetical protein